MMAAFNIVRRVIGLSRNVGMWPHTVSRFQSTRPNLGMVKEKLENPRPTDLRRRIEPSAAARLTDIGTRAIFTEEHDVFRTSVRRFFAEEVVPNYLSYEKQGYVDREMWEKMGAAGMLGVATPAEMGGVGADFKCAAIVAEERGYANDAGTIGWTLHSDVLMPYIEEYGTPEQRQKYIPGMAQGKIIGSLAMTEQQAGSDLQGLRTTATRDGEDWILNGSKMYITNGYLCDMSLVAAITDINAKRKAHGMSLFLVDTASPGFHKGKPMRKLGQNSGDTTELHFENVRLPKEALLGGEENLNRGFYLTMKQVLRERLMVGLLAQAHAECMFEMTRDYIKERKAFGQTLSKLQVMQHRLAEMKTELCVARAFVDQCLHLFCEKRLDVGSVSMLKYWTSELCSKIAGECVQLHGGVGYTWDHPISRGFASSKVYPIFTGSSEIMKELIARGITSET